MENETIEITAESLQKAREKTPVGYRVTSEQIISTGEQEIVIGKGVTIGVAFEDARSRIPTSVKVLEEEELRPPTQRIITVNASNEQMARAKVIKEINYEEQLHDIQLAIPGRKKLLGLIKSPDSYKVTVIQNAIVRVTFKSEARIRLKLRKIPSTDELIVSAKKLKDMAYTCLYMQKQNMENVSDVPLVQLMGNPSELAIDNLRVLTTMEQIIDSFEIILADAKHLFPNNKAITEFQFLRDTVAIKCPTDFFCYDEKIKSVIAKLDTLINVLESHQYLTRLEQDHVPSSRG
ncbi:MAG: hypothetical protein NT096_00660 [Proteobacteria bacterium]|nr:hypothetical protein [Pseudomonadota bacterium]